MFLDFASPKTHFAGLKRQRHQDLKMKRINEDQHSANNLKTAVIQSSVAKKWTHARREWKFCSASKSKEFTNCECGVRIKNVCTIQNVKNGNTLVVGSTCVKYFGDPQLNYSTAAMTSLLTLLDDSKQANANDPILKMAEKHGIITSRQRTAYNSIKKVKNPSQKQSKLLLDLNDRIVSRLTSLRQKT